MTEAQDWVIKNAKDYNFGNETAYNFAERAYDAGVGSYKKRIIELESQIEKMKMCCNCDNWRGYGERLDHISYPCCQHDCDSVCPKWKLWERR